MLAIEDELLALVVNSGAHRDHTGGALMLELRDSQGRVKRVAGDHAPQEFGLNLDEADQGVAYHVREQSGARGGKTQHLQSVCKWCCQPALFAVFVIVVDRVIVT